MQIVIDIPEYVYVDIQDRFKHPNKGEGISVLEDAVANGTPLPKGHGRLKDIDKIISDGISKGFCEWYDEMKYAPTIIEADKESEEKE